MTDSTARRQSPTVTCQRDVTACEGEFHGICALPAGHGGDCDFVDAMGMCGVNDNCRASRGGMWGDNGYDHNHRPLPYLMKNRDGSTPLAEDELSRYMQMHGLRYSEIGGERGHIADVKAGITVTAEDGTEFALLRS